MPMILRSMMTTGALIFCLAINAGCSGVMTSEADVQDATMVMTIVATEAANLSPAEARKGIEIVGLVEKMLLESVDEEGRPNWEWASDSLSGALSMKYQAVGMALFGMIQRRVSPMLESETVEQVKRYLRAAGNGARIGLKMAAAQSSP